MHATARCAAVAGRVNRIRLRHAIVAQFDLVCPGGLTQFVGEGLELAGKRAGAGGEARI